MQKNADPVRKRSQMDAAAMRTYPNIAKAWGLKEHDAARLLGVADSTYRRWKRSPEHASPDVSQRERMSLMTYPLRAVQWHSCYRIIPSRFPPVDLFEGRHHRDSVGTRGKKASMGSSTQAYVMLAESAWLYCGLRHSPLPGKAPI